MIKGINNWTKTALTTISDSYLFLVSLTTGETKPISFGTIKSLLKTYFQGQNLTFTEKIKAPNGTATTEVVNFQQLNTKINKSDDKFTGRVTFDAATGFNLPEYTGTVPTTNSDPMGNVGDIMRVNKRIYCKTNYDGWCYIDLTRL